MGTSTLTRIIATSHGCLAVEQAGNRGMPVLLIHGNSFSRYVFRHQLQGRLTEHYNLIAFDLPGHGESGNAPDPVRSYTRSGFAEATVELLDTLRVSEAVVFGWSLGGRIGIDMLTRFPGMRGLMITGTHPVGVKNMAQCFRRSSHSRAAGPQDLSEADIHGFVEAVFGASAEPVLRDSVARADGRFRRRLFEAARTGEAGDQRLAVKRSTVPLAVVNGAEDRMINLDYVDSVAYGNLWEGRYHRMAALGHAPFWEAPDDFDRILERFLHDVETGRAASRIV